MLPKYVQLLIVVLVVSIMLISAPSQGAVTGSSPAIRGVNVECQGSVLAVRREISSIQSKITLLQFQYDATRKKLESVRLRVQEGLAPNGETLPYEIETVQLQTQLTQYKAVLSDVKRLAAIAEPVDIVLKSINIRQATQALSRASGVNITVDPKVPASVTVSTKAWSVPLGAVLEVIANSANLIIAPADNGGLMLKPSGTLLVDGKSVNYQGNNLPWSNEWTSACRSTDCPIGRRWLRLFENESARTPSP